MAITVDGTNGVTFPNSSIQEEASFDSNQTWQSVTRTSGVEYTNSTGKPIQLLLTVNPSSNAGVTIGGIALFTSGNIVAAAGTRTSCTFIIPAGSTYTITIGAGTVSTFELR